MAGTALSIQSARLLGEKALVLVDGKRHRRWFR
jgi:hypothetical protein